MSQGKTANIQESKQMKKIIQMVRGAFKKMKHDNLRLAGGTT